MSNKRDRIPENLALLICVAAGGVFLAALAIITAFTEIPAFPAALVFLLVYCAAAAAVCLLVRSPAVFRMSEKERASIGSLMTDTLRGIEMPAAITTEDGKIVWSNAAIQRAAGSGETLAGLNFGSFCTVPVSALIAADPSEGARAEIKDSPYLVRAYEMSTQDRKYYLLTRDDL